MIKKPVKPKTTDVARDRHADGSRTVLPVEVARGVYMRNAPGLQALKLMHLMIAKAGGAMADDMAHEFRLSEIRAIEGMANHSSSSLEPLFVELRAAVLTYVEASGTLVIGGLLDEARVHFREESGDLRISWYFSRSFRRMAADSNHWAILDRQTVFHLGSKYSVLLFQHIASLVNLDHVQSKTFAIEELRAVLAVPAGKLTRFSNMNAWALQPSINEINRLSRFTLTATPNKVGRAVASVTISWQMKEASRSEKEVARRQAIPSKRPFPASGSIAYVTHWVDLKHAAGCNMDNGLIADRFRAWCKSKGIALNAPNIEQAFQKFCAKVGRV